MGTHCGVPPRTWDVVYRTWDAVYRPWDAVSWTWDGTQDVLSRVGDASLRPWVPSLPLFSDPACTLKGAPIVLHHSFTQHPWVCAGLHQPTPLLQALNLGTTRVIDMDTDVDIGIVLGYRGGGKKVCVWGGGGGRAPLPWEGLGKGAPETET